jgi:hypothetical protein
MSDRYLSAHLFAGFPFPAPAEQKRQVIEMCK